MELFSQNILLIIEHRVEDCGIYCSKMHFFLFNIPARLIVRKNKLDLFHHDLTPAEARTDLESESAHFSTTRLRHGYEKMNREVRQRAEMRRKTDEKSEEFFGCCVEDVLDRRIGNPGCLIVPSQWRTINGGSASEMRRP
jgi:hypothetical protein